MFLFSFVFFLFWAPPLKHPFSGASFREKKREKELPAFFLPFREERLVAPLAQKTTISLNILKQREREKVPELIRKCAVEISSKDGTS